MATPSSVSMRPRASPSVQAQLAVSSTINVGGPSSVRRARRRAFRRPVPIDKSNAASPTTAAVTRSIAASAYSRTRPAKLGSASASRRVARSKVRTADPLAMAAAASTFAGPAARPPLTAEAVARTSAAPRPVAPRHASNSARIVGPTSAMAALSFSIAAHAHLRKRAGGVVRPTSAAASRRNVRSSERTAAPLTTAVFPSNAAHARHRKRAAGAGRPTCVVASPNLRPRLVSADAFLHPTVAAETSIAARSAQAFQESATRRRESACRVHLDA